MRLVALEGQSPNIPGALTSGIQAGQAFRAVSESRKVGQLAASGDMAGAQKAALSTGNPDIINMLSTMDDRQRAAIKEHQDQVARLAYMVKNAPPQEKQKALTWALGEAGKFMSPDDIKKSLPPDLNSPGAIDQWADGVISQASSLDQLFERADKEKVYGLKERDFQADQDYRKQTLALEREKLAAKSNGSGTSLSFDPATGAFSFEQGEGVTGGVRAPLGTAGKTEAEKKIMSGVDLLSRVNSVAAQFKPEYQTIGNRAGKAWLGAQAKAGLKLDPKQQAQLEDYATYRSTAIENLNSTLKEMSGAAVTPQEFERIKSAFPNAGTGIFDGDDPVTFKSKMDRVTRDTKLAIARYTYWRNAGTGANPWDNMSLADMPTVMAKRESELSEEIKSANPGADESAVRSAVRDAMRKEFGL